MPCHYSCVDGSSYGEEPSFLFNLAHLSFVYIDRVGYDDYNFLWPNVKTKKKSVPFFTNFLIGVQIFGKRKQYIENGAGTMFFGAIFFVEKCPKKHSTSTVFDAVFFIFLLTELR